MIFWNTNIYTYIFIVIYSTGFISCLNSGRPSESNNKKEILSQDELGYLEMDCDSVLIPAFEIEVSLSPNAEKKLKEENETVIVSAMFSGIPKDTTSEEYLIWGQMGINDFKIELANQRLARFEKVRFHSSVLNKLFAFCALLRLEMIVIHCPILGKYQPLVLPEGRRELK